tara:strand:- start:251 stop:2011 length:1761 start_codon:yes stop_codon:yes gene_type:complete
MSANKLRVTELDFDGIKNNLITHFKQSSEFGSEGSYNFEGSALSMLLDVLAYNTHYMGYYVNMLANEMFLDSASKRESIVSIAKHLGYTPKSANCARITFDATNNGTENSTVYPIGIENNPATIFEGKNEDDKIFTFYPIDEQTIVGEIGKTESITCMEGKLVNRSYIVDTNNLDQKYTLDKNIDTSTLKVSIKSDSSSSTRTPYTLFEDISSMKDGNIYYLNEIEAGQYEIVFGDGVDTGNKLSDGNVILLTYLISSEAEPNGINEISLATGGDSLTLKVTSHASGGSEPQSDESIRFMAPKSFQHKNRAVTVDDYATLIADKYPLDSVITWGGEENDPVAFGKVFIAIRPIDGEVLTDADKLMIRTELLQKNKVIGIIPEVIDPDYTYLKASVNVVYDSTKAIVPAGTIMNNVISSITSYNKTELDKFDQSFRFSPLSTAIDDSDTSIVSNHTALSLYKKVMASTVSNSVDDSWELKFNTELDSITSNFFTSEDYENVRFMETEGVLNLHDITGVVVKSNVGLVSSSGRVDINPINIISTDDVDSNEKHWLTFISTIDQKDVEPIKGQVISIKDIDIDVTMERA